MNIKKLLQVFASTLLISAPALACEDCNEIPLIRYTGVGVAAVRPDDPRPLVVKQLMAIRAAKLEALRSLAEQTQGITLNSKSELAGTTLVNDRLIIETQTVLQGVRFVKVEPLQNGFYQAIAEIDLHSDPSEKE